MRSQSIVALALGVAVCACGHPAMAIDWRRIGPGDMVVVEAEGAEFYVEQAVKMRLPQGTSLKVLELGGQKDGDPVKPWVGTTVMVDGKPTNGWVHSRKLFKRDDPAAVAALKALKKVKIENDRSGNIWVLKAEGADSELTGGALEHVKKLYNLEGLELTGAKLADDDLVHLAGLTNLQWLYLDETPISDKGLEHLKGLSNLDVLALSKSKVTGSGLPNLKDMKRLRVLNLSDCKITDAALENVKGLGKIQTIALENTPITGDGLKHFQGMPDLNVINLQNCKLEKGSLSHMKGNSNLRIVFLKGATYDEADKKALDDAITSLAIFTD